jgi:hypothetical protein
MGQFNVASLISHSSMNHLQRQKSISSNFSYTSRKYLQLNHILLNESMFKQISELSKLKLSLQAKTS